MDGEPWLEGKGADSRERDDGRGLPASRSSPAPTDAFRIGLDGEFWVALNYARFQFGDSPLRQRLAVWRAR